MINIPIWLLVLLCVFAFIGVCVACIIVYGLAISIFEKDYVYLEEEENGEQKNKQS